MIQDYRYDTNAIIAIKLMLYDTDINITTIIVSNYDLWDYYHTVRLLLWYSFGNDARAVLCDTGINGIIAMMQSLRQYP